MEIFSILSTLDYIDFRELSHIVKEKMDKHMQESDYECYNNYLRLYKKLDLLAEYLEKYK